MTSKDETPTAIWIPSSPEDLVDILIQVYSAQQLVLAHDLLCEHLTLLTGTAGPPH